MVDRQVEGEKGNSVSKKGPKGGLHAENCHTLYLFSSSSIRKKLSDLDGRPGSDFCTFVILRITRQPLSCKLIPIIDLGWQLSSQVSRGELGIACWGKGPGRRSREAPRLVRE